MNDVEHFNLSTLLMYLVHDDIGRLNKLAGPWIESWSSHVGEARRCQLADPLADAPNHLGSRARLVSGDPREDVVEVRVGPFAENDSYAKTAQSLVELCERQSLGIFFSAPSPQLGKLFFG